MKLTLHIPPTYFYLSVTFSIMLYLIFPGMRLISFPINLSGLVLIFSGGFLVIYCLRLLKKHDTPERFTRSTCIVKNGPYKFTRNPMYLAMVTMSTGIAILLGNIISFISPLLLFIIIQFSFIPFEEKKMEATFGNEYLDYKNRVRRWI